MSNAMDQAVRLLTAWNELAVVNGDDSYCALDAFIRQTDYRKIVLFTGRRSADESGAVARVLASLRYTECGVVRFNNIPAEPDMSVVESMCDFLRAEEPDGVIALGGGVVAFVECALLLFLMVWIARQCAVDVTGLSKGTVLLQFFVNNTPLSVLALL